MALNIHIDTKKLIKLILTIILISILIYIGVKIIRKLFCKKEIISLPNGLLFSETNDDLAFYTISSSSLF